MHIILRFQFAILDSIAAIVDGDSLTEIYSKVKNVVHEQSGNLIWVPSNDTL